jgi:SAM-dependent methyltransferase
VTPEEAALDIIRKLFAEPKTNEPRRRELLVGHLAALFPDYEWQLSEFAMGAETAVRVPKQNGEGPTTGRIDTRKGALFIEYKRDLADPVLRTEAETELKKYVAGVINKEGITGVSKCISTDILTWQEYSLKISPRAIGGQITPGDVELLLLGEYRFTESDASKFVIVVRRLIYEDVPLVATAKLLNEHFGLDSPRYKDFRTNLSIAWKRCRHLRETKLGLKLWSDFVENCFDKKAVPNEDTYLDHVYLVILARMIAASALSTPPEQTRTDFPIRSLTGDFFSSGVHRVDRFVEEDFFRWAKSDVALDILRTPLQDLHVDLQKLDFRSAKKFDLLTELYQKIMPPQRRIEYGEVFTPTWLTKRIVEQLPTCGQIGTKVLDPGCGTGSFLRAVVEKKLQNIKMEWSAQEVLDKVLADICGLDINPVSIIIAKTALMLTLAEWLSKSDKLVEIPVFLCDSLFLPKGLLSKKRTDKVVVAFDNVGIQFPSRIFREGTWTFDEIVRTADQFASDLSKKEISRADCTNALDGSMEAIARSAKLDDKSKRLLKNAARRLVLELSDRISHRRNNVWAFVLRNTYRPSLLSARFDVIVCNPPWLAMSRFPRARYKKQLENLVAQYHLAPPKASRHHFEISTVFAAHSISHYLIQKGNFGFILPHVILTGDQHDPLRRSKFKQYAPMKVLKVWDLEDVDDLFGRPACSVFGTSDELAAGFPQSLPCTVLSGDPTSNLTETETELQLSTLGTKSSFTTKTHELSADESYWPMFRQGADLMPRRAVMVDLIGSKTAQTPSVQTSAAEKANRDNKPPWNKIDLSGTVEPSYIFTTLKSDAVLSYVVGNPSHAVLPVKISSGKFTIISQRDLSLSGHIRAKAWFRKVDTELMRLGKKKLESWIKRKNKLTDQSAKGHQNLVVFGAGGTNICAAVINTTTPKFPFVNDQTLYAWEAPSADEAWYVCGMLNSQAINIAIKGHQPKGKFGEQHIHKLPLSLIPRFKSQDPKHVALAGESKRIADAASALVKTDMKYLNSAKTLASRRRMFVSALSPELQTANNLAREIFQEAQASEPDKTKSD